MSHIKYKMGNIQENQRTQVSSRLDKELDYAKKTKLIDTEIEKIIRYFESEFVEQIRQQNILMKKLLIN